MKVSLTSVATACSAGSYLNSKNVCTTCAASTDKVCESSCLSAGFYTDGNTCK